MPPNIVYLPGIFGSRIGLPPAFLFPGFDVWISPYTALTGILLQLQLGADGVSPGPLTRGVNWQPTGLLEETYRPLGNFMRNRGWNVLDAAYDWRLSVRNSAPQVLAAINAQFGQQSFIFVCHSMGGLVARAVYALLLNAGLGPQVQGLITLGTPHFGSWEVQRGFFGLPQLYQALAHFAGAAYPFNIASYRPDFLDVILASWPGWYELAPWRDSGPLFLQDPATARALYQAPTYAGGNPYVQQKWLDAAAVTQDYLAPAIPFGAVKCIRGRGFITANQLNPPNPLSKPEGYAYTNDGDSQVPMSYATVATAVNIDLPEFHGWLPLSQRVALAVLWAVQTFAGPGA